MSQDTFEKLKAEIRAEVIAELRDEFMGLFDRLGGSIDSGGLRRRGRAKKKNGRRKSARKSKGAKAKSGKSKNAPRGQLEKEVKKVLGAKPKRISVIRDAVSKTPHFKGRDPKTLYTQISVLLRKMKGAKKSGKAWVKVG